MSTRYDRGRWWTIVGRLIPRGIRRLRYLLLIQFVDTAELVVGQILIRSITGDRRGQVVNIWLDEIFGGRTSQSFPWHFVRGVTSSGQFQDLVNSQLMTLLAEVEFAFVYVRQTLRERVVFDLYHFNWKPSRVVVEDNSQEFWPALRCGEKADLNMRCLPIRRRRQAKKQYVIIWSPGMKY